MTNKKLTDGFIEKKYKLYDKIKIKTKTLDFIIACIVVVLLAIIIYGLIRKLS